MCFRVGVGGLIRFNLGGEGELNIWSFVVFGTKKTRIDYIAPEKPESATF